jgi:hypothetical protein
LTPEEKKAQRDAVNAAKAAKKAEAAAKKQAKLMEEPKEDEEEEPQDKKKKKEKKGASQVVPPLAQTPVPQDTMTPLAEPPSSIETMSKSVSFNDAIGVPQSAAIPASKRKMSILEEKNVSAHPREKLVAS